MRIGWELQQTSDEDSDVTYWRNRLFPYAYGEVDWKPFFNFNQENFKYYSEFNGIIEDFQLGVFADLTFWWDWKAIDTTGSGTRKVCWAVGKFFDAITIKITTQRYIYDCYLTIISNLLDPGAEFTSGRIREWTECDDSDQIDAPIWESVFFDDDNAEEFWVGADVSFTETNGCTSALFTNPLVANMYDIAISSMWPGYGTKKIGGNQK